MKDSSKLSLYQGFINFFKSLILLFFISQLNLCLINAQETDTIQVGAGWNMIGSLTTGPASDILRSEPDTIIVSAFFAYNPGGGYEAKDTLKKGTGYWVKVNADGLIIFGGGSGEWTCGNTIEYSGKVYNTVLIGNQCWLRENLDVGTRIDGSLSQTNNAVIEKYCYDNMSENCDIYGGLYLWDEAMQYTTVEGAKGICPTGWHIPTWNDMATLYATVGGNGNALKAIGQGSGAGAGTNTSGFSALLAGMAGLGGFANLNSFGIFWSSMVYSSTDAMVIGLVSTASDITGGNFAKGYGVSIRCLKD